MLCFNNASDVDKLQRLQNRCLRSCYDVYNPMDLGTYFLHHTARVNKLDLRRDIQLLNIMFSLKMKNMYKKESGLQEMLIIMYLRQT